MLEAIGQQGVPSSYVSLLRLLCRQQRGVVPGAEPFAITRGIRQGDGISPALLNAALEVAARHWRQRLEGAGLQLAGRDTNARLTDLRYADDLLLFANSLGQAKRMLEALQDELVWAGLSTTKRRNIF